MPWPHSVTACCRSNINVRQFHLTISLVCIRSLVYGDVVPNIILQQIISWKVWCCDYLLRMAHISSTLWTTLRVKVSGNISRSDFGMSVGWIKQRKTKCSSRTVSISRCVCHGECCCCSCSSVCQRTVYSPCLTFVLIIWMWTVWEVIVFGGFSTGVLLMKFYCNLTELF